MKFTHNPLYANFWARLLAAMIDGLIIGIYIPFVLFYLFSSASIATLLSQLIILLTLVILPVQILKIIYVVESTHRFGKTIGKAIVGLEVVDEKGKFLPRGMSFFREYIAKPINIFFFLGFLSILVNKDHRGWHDELAGTVVKKKSDGNLLGIIIVFVLLIFYGVIFWKAGNTIAQNGALQADAANQSTLASQPASASASVETIVPSPSPLISVIPSAQAQSWLMAAGGILSAQNNESFDQMKDTIPLQDLKPLLADGWGIQDHDSAIKTLEWLKTFGHSGEFDQMRTLLLDRTHGDPAVYHQMKPALMKEFALESPFQTVFVLDFVWKHKDDLAEKKLYAWDYGRTMNVARWSYAAGYISETEAFSYMMYAGTRLQQEYTSWDDFASNYLLGRTFWHHSPVQGDVETQVHWLETSQVSPWQSIDWNTDLSK